MVSEAKEVKFTDGDVEWAGQTIADGGEGRVLFGRDSKGALHIEIVCDHRAPYHRENGVVVNRAISPDGAAVVSWLADWFLEPDHEEDR